MHWFNTVIVVIGVDLIRVHIRYISDGTVGTNSYVQYYGYNITSDTYYIQDR